MAAVTLCALAAKSSTLISGSYIRNADGKTCTEPALLQNCEFDLDLR